MSKTIKSMITRDYTAKTTGVADAMVISLRGVKAIETTKLRRKLATNKIKITVMRNSLARKSFKGTGLEGLAALLEGPSALCYGHTSVVEAARELVALVKDLPGIELKGAILDGTLFKGKAGVEELSKYPTRGEAIGKAVALLVGPGRNLGAQIKGPGSNIAGILKAIEAKLEKGEKIEKQG